MVSIVCRMGKCATIGVNLEDAKATDRHETLLRSALDDLEHLDQSAFVEINLYSWTRRGAYSTLHEANDKRDPASRLALKRLIHGVSNINTLIRRILTLFHEGSCFDKASYSEGTPKLVKIKA